jgi:hypothetical protein
MLRRWLDGNGKGRGAGWVAGKLGGSYGGNARWDGQRKTAHRGLKRGKVAFRSFPLKRAGVVGKWDGQSGWTYQGIVMYENGR